MNQFWLYFISLTLFLSACSHSKQEQAIVKAQLDSAQYYRNQHHTVLHHLNQVPALSPDHPLHLSFQEHRLHALYRLDSIPSHELLAHIHEALSTQQENKADSTQTAALVRLHFLKGSVLNKLNKQNQALKSYQKAMYLAEKIQYKDLGALYGMLGLVSRNLHDYKAALHYYQKALTLFSEKKDSMYIGYTYTNLSTVYKYKESADSAIFYDKKAIAISTLLNDSVSVLENQYNLSLDYRYFDSIPQALEAIKGLIPIAKQHYPNDQLPAFYEHLGTLHYLYKNKDSARFYYDLALKQIQQNGSVSDSADMDLAIYSSLAWLYCDSTHFLDSVNTKTDRLQALQNQGIETKTTLELENLKKEQEILHIQQQQKIRYYQMALILLVLSIALYAFTMRLKKSKKRLEQQTQINQQLKEDQIDKNKQLLQLGESIVDTNELLKRVVASLEQYKKTGSIADTGLEIEIKNKLGNASDREIFHFYLTQLQEGFFTKLKKQYPDLTANEEKICGFLKLNLNSKQMATLLNVEEKSVEMYRYRLRKKFNLNKEDSLSDFLIKN